MEPIQYLNGEWVKLSEAKVSVFDISVTRGFGVFDAFRTYNRKGFMVDAHFARLQRSSAMVGIQVPFSLEEFETIVKEGINKNPQGELLVKVILTGGVSDDGISPAKASVVIQFSPTPLRPTEPYRLITFPIHPFLAGAKSTSYMRAVVAIQAAKAAGANEVVYVDERNGNLLEGVTSNFFAVIDGKLYTPVADVLHGITRMWIIQECAKLGIEVVEGPVHKSQIPNMQEAFLASSTKEASVSVIDIDGQQIGDGQVGPIAQKLQKAFEEFTATY